MKKNTDTFVCMCCCCFLVTQSCLTLCDPMDCSPPRLSIPGILQARIPEWVAIFFSRRCSRPRGWSRVSCLAGRFFATESPGRHMYLSTTNLHLLRAFACNWLSTPTDGVQGGVRLRSRESGGRNWYRNPNPWSSSYLEKHYIPSWWHLLLGTSFTFVK